MDTESLRSSSSSRLTATPTEDPTDTLTEASPATDTDTKKETFQGTDCSWLERTGLLTNRHACLYVTMAAPASTTLCRCY
mmetsp:Transcript_7833/g.15562  ORF Transcript_7833/g.15562 Transcript_7833/m.15562 type:complete len:80 (+) Transcript_7833:932-1171(+)